MAKVAWIGLGVMGAPMAGHIYKKGNHDIVIWNRTAAKADAWVAQYGGGSIAKSPVEAADCADFVFSCVGNDNDLRAVTTGPYGAFAAMKPGACFIDNTTTSAIVARELDALARVKAFNFLDAPVSGGQAGAENGQLTVMVGGDESAYKRAEPVIACYARVSKLMGAAGSGQLTKMVNQICIAGLLQGLSEGLNFAEKSGLDAASVIEAISKGAAQSWQMENRWETMTNGKFDFGFAVDWMRKDLGICLEEAGKNGASLPVTALIDQFYGDIQRKGGGRYDTSSLITQLNGSG